MFRTIFLALALLVFPALLKAQDATLYWTGTNGNWNDASNWSATPKGTGGAGVPRNSDVVVISPDRDVRIHLSDVNWCGDLRVAPRSGRVVVEGDAATVLNITGGWSMQGDVRWDMAGITRMAVRKRMADVNVGGVELKGDVTIDGSGGWNLLSDLKLAADHALTVKEGTLVTNGNHVVCGDLRFTGAGRKSLLAGGSVVEAQRSLDAGSVRSAVVPGSSHLLVRGAPMAWGALAAAAAEAERGISVCGTGPGQTPFTINAQVLTNYNGYNVRCTGSCDATVTVTVTGGIGPFVYSWSTGPNTQTWTNTCVGNKLVIVTDQGQNIGCAATVQVLGPPPVGVIFFPALTPPSCAQTCDGTGNALAVGGTGGGYTYNWNNGAGTGSSFNQLCAGANTLEVRDQNNCLFDTTFTIPLQPVAPVLTVTNATCNGGCDGEADVVVTGGTGTYTFTWAPAPPLGQGTPNVSGLCPGPWNVTISDVNGCDTTLTFQITQPPPIVPNSSSTDVTCASQCDGTAAVAPSGAVGPFTFLWSPAPGGGQGTGSVTSLCAGNYTVLITDQASGCDTLVSITINTPSALDPQPTITDASCAGECDGSVILVVTGGVGPYAYTWAPNPPVGQGTPSVSGLCPGPWSVTVTDVSGCDTTVAFTINAPPPILPNESHTDVTCAGDCDGTATCAPTGGVGPYTYLWSPVPPSGQGTPTASGLCAGPWTVTITDANGCDTTVQFLILEPPPLTQTSSQTNVSCGTNCDGTASVVISGGTPNYTYVWSPAPGGGQGTPNATGLCAGPYSVLVTDALGCTLTVPFTITAPVPLQLSLQVTPASCPDVCDGTAGVIVTGGTAGYTYVWSPAPGAGQGTANVTGLCPGAYSLTVTDALNCDTTISFTINAPPPIAPNAVVTDAVCPGTCNGTVLLAPTGGNGTYTYVWAPVPSNGQGTAQALGLCAGNIQVTIASGGCDTTLTFTIDQPPPIVASLTSTPALCWNTCDASATAAVTGGTPNYTYAWAPAPGGGQGTPNATGLCAGSYTLTIADALGCDTTIAFTVTAPAPIDAGLTVENASCGGSCDGEANVQPTGGTPGYVITWAPPPGGGQGTSTATGLCPGVYTVNIADAAGCDTTVQFTVVTPSGIISVPSIVAASCADVCDGSVVLSTQGGVPPYTYNWSPSPGTGQGTPSVGGLCAGDYTVNIGDQAGCDTVFIVTVPSPPAILPNGTFTNENCNGPCTGTASVAPTGGLGSFTFLWSPQPGAGQGTANVTGLCAGNWTCTVGDASGCDTVFAFTVLPEQPIDPGLTYTDADCWNECNGAATVNPTGGAGGFTYAWTPNPPVGQGTPSVSGLCLGFWEVTITDVAGCDTTIGFVIFKPSPLQPNLVVEPEDCNGACTGQAAVFPFGGTPGYSVLWDPPPGGGQGTNIATGLCAGQYTVTITDANGCDTTTTFQVVPFTPITPNLSSTPVSCSNACDGTATVGPTGGEQPYAYTWDPVPPIGQGTPSASGLCAGVYSLTIFDASACDTTVTVLIAGPAPLDASATVQNVQCAGACDGSIVLNTQGGTPNYQYTWTPVPPNGQGTNTATDLCPGAWSVTIVDANGCDTTVSFTITEPAPLTSAPTVVQSQCQVCIGSILMATVGGSGIYTYTWGAPLNLVTTDPFVQNLCAGIYAVTVQDPLGCSLTFAVPVPDSNGEVLSMNDGITSCPNTCDGTVSVSFACSAPTCAIAWTDGLGNTLPNTTDTLSGLCDGIYFAQVTNGDGCVSIDTAIVTTPTPITLTISSSPVSCSGLCDGTAAIGLSGGQTPYAITWSPAPGGGQGTPFVTGLCPGVYSVLIADGGGCDTTYTVLITSPTPLQANATVQGISCAGQCDADITLATSGGSGTYAFTWSPVPPNGQGNAQATSLCAGTWNVLIIDGSGCDTTLTFVITDPLPLTLFVAATPSQCQVCNGTATASVSGGTGTATITWTDAGGVSVGSGAQLTGSCAGFYTALVVDANGCSTQATIAVSDADGELLTTVDGQTLCAGSCDGQVGVVLTCTNGPCTIQWTDGLGALLGTNVFDVGSLCVGDYYVQVTNGAGCVTIDTASVIPSTQIIPNISSTPGTCAGACDATATAGPVGGVGPYIYTWTPAPPIGQGTPQAAGLCPGVYSVLIVDQSGCDTTVTVLILGPQQITAAANQSDVSCNGVCDGSITLTAQGGTGTLSYDWSPAPPVGQGTASVDGLCAGTWTVTIADANGCDTLLTFQITEPQTLSLSTASTESVCGQCIGTATATPTGGTGPFGYSWSQNGAVFSTDSLAIGLCAGLYTVTVTDANGCSASTSVPVTDPDGEVLVVTDGLTGCPGECNGEASVAFACSIPTCSIIWFDAQNNAFTEPGNVLDSLCAGTYFVQVTNGNGCISIDTALVTEPDPIIANLSTTPATCAGACDGVATVGPTGGIGTYTYLWDPVPPVGQGTPQASGLCAGVWSVTITDSVGCSIVVPALILEPQSISVTATITLVTCNGACDGGVDVVVQGGTGPFTLTWSPQPPIGQGTASIDSLCAGDWTLAIVDANGCDTSITFTLIEPPLLLASVGTTNNQCYGDCQGTASATVAGGVLPYATSWTTSGGAPIAQDTSVIGGLCSGDYLFVVTDSNGCTLSTPFTITQGVAIDGALLFSNETCLGPCDGTATVNPSGGAGVFTILWQPQPGGGQGTTQATGLCSGNWSVIITDTLGCDTTLNFTILPFTPILPNATLQNVLCNGACNGSIQLAPTGGLGGYVYNWSPVPPNGPGTSSATGLCPGVWSVTIADNVGCDTTVTFTITEPDTLLITVDLVVEASCATANDGAIDITITGGTQGYAITWTGPNFSSAQDDISALLPGLYTVTVTDANGCQTTLPITVNALVTVVADAGPDLSQCEQVVIVLDGSASQGGTSYQWTNANGVVVGSTAVLPIGNLPNGSYIFILTVTDGPCSDVDSVAVNILALPLANAGADQTIIGIGEVTLGGSPSGPVGSSFIWAPDSLLNAATVPNPTTSPLETTIYTLAVTAPNGCIDTDTVVVTVVPEIVIPSGFTPNGDGWNDGWQIDLIGMFPACEVEVYNRWGELLFSSVGYKVPWDGRYSGGLVPVGTYYYVIKLNDPKFPEAYTGPLTVIR